MEDWEVERKIEKVKERAHEDLVVGICGGICLGSLLTAYCWIPSRLSVEDSNHDGRSDIVVEQMNGSRRKYIQQQNGAYELEKNYLDELPSGIW